jgi:two-component sensor histidine kinase
LVEHIKGVFNTKDGILFKLEVENIILDADIAVAIGLITNELVTNSLKHAFGELGGTVFLKLTRTGKSTLSLVLADDGRGLPAKGEEKKTSFGLKIVKRMAEQLNATVIVKTGNGTSYQMNVDY